MANYQIRALAGETWDAFAELAQRHNGVWGGCWCMAFHPKSDGWGTSAALNRDNKEARVRAGAAHAALVFEGDTCLGWCQFGPPAELPRIKHRRAYLSGAGQVPDWRITCFFVDKTARGRGVAEAALEGAIDLIAMAGGGVVESMPDDRQGKPAPAAFLWNASLSLFERKGFSRIRPLGKTAWLVRRDVAPRPTQG